MCEKHYRRYRKSGTVETSLIANPLARYEENQTGCWIWTGPKYPNGYGKTSRDVHGTRIAHRALYMELVGEIPEGHDLDHLCRVRECVNPSHLEPVNRSENIQRGWAARSDGKCAAGLHDMSLPGAWYRNGAARTCRECWRIRYRKSGAKYRARRKQEQE